MARNRNACVVLLFVTCCLLLVANSALAGQPIFNQPLSYYRAFPDPNDPVAFSSGNDVYVAVVEIGDCKDRESRFNGLVVQENEYLRQRIMPNGDIGNSSGHIGVIRYYKVFTKPSSVIGYFTSEAKNYFAPYQVKATGVYVDARNITIQPWVYIP